MSVALHTQCCVEKDSKLRMKFSPYETDELFTPPHRCNKHPRKASELKSHTILWASPNLLVCQHCVESLGHLTRWCEMEPPSARLYNLNISDEWRPGSPRENPEKRVNAAPFAQGRKPHRWTHGPPQWVVRAEP